MLKFLAFIVFWVWLMLCSWFTSNGVTEKALMWCILSGIFFWKIIKVLLEAEEERERKELEGDRPKWQQEKPPRVMKEWKPDFIPENTNHPVKCPNADCDEMIAPEWKFCNRCGLKVR